VGAWTHNFKDMKRSSSQAGLQLGPLADAVFFTTGELTQKTGTHRIRKKGQKTIGGGGKKVAREAHLVLEK